MSGGEADSPWPAGTRTPGEVRSTLSGKAGDVVQARDVSGGVHFYTDVPAEFGPAPRQLPPDVRGFVNRVTDLEVIDQIANESDGGSNVILIVGTAGVGKTSLAVRWAHHVRERYTDGQLYINLRGYDPGAPLAPENALEHFLRALRTPPEQIPADLEARSALFRSLVADRQMLIVLDNAAKAAQVRPLLPGQGSSLVVVTSRDRMSGLIARDGARCIEVDVLAEDESINLLRQTTSPYRGGDDEEEIRLLARLCAHLPLALRIAAERAAARPRMSLSTLIRQLRNDDIWEALSADDEDEAAAVRAVFAWSYRALTVDVARMFRLLGLHPGPDFSAGAAAALAGVTPGKARSLLGELVRAHLIEQRAEDRYQFHDLLRAYAVDQLRHEEDVSGRLAALHRELDWYLRTSLNASATAQSILISVIEDLPPQQSTPETFESRAPAISWYDQERPSLVAAAQAAVGAGRDETAWQLAAAAYPVANVLRDAFDDLLKLQDVGLKAARRLGADRAAAAILGNIGMTLNLVNRHDEAERYQLEAIEVARRINDVTEETRNTNNLGWAYVGKRRLEDAITVFSATRDAASSLPQLKRWYAVAQINLAATYVLLGQLDTALPLAQSALDAHATPDAEPRLLFDALRHVAQIRTRLGDFEDAELLVDRAGLVAQQIGSQSYEGIVALERGRLELARGKYEECLALFHLSAGVGINMADRVLEAQSYEGAGDASRRAGRPDEAVNFHRAAAKLFRQSQDAWQLGTTLSNMALAFDALGEMDAAGEQRRMSIEAIEGFTDAPARALKAELEAASRRDRSIEN